MNEQRETALAVYGADFAQLDDHDPRRLVVERSLAYVRNVLASSSRRRNVTELEPLIAATAVHLHDARRPSWRAVRRWVRANEADGRDVCALLPNYEARGNRKAKASGKPLERYEDTDYEKVQTVAKFL